MKVTNAKDLKTLGTQARKRMSDAALRIQVGTSTCGLARRADLVKKALEAEVQKQDLKADIVEVGCNGMCYQEPVVDVIQQGRPKITYGAVSADKAAALVTAIGNLAKAGDPCGRGERIGVEGAGMADFRGLRARIGEAEELHHFPAPADGASGEAAGEDFGEGREVRLEAFDFLDTARRPAKASHHLIHDEDDSLGAAEGLEFVEEAPRHRELPTRCPGGLDDDSTDVAALFHGTAHFGYLEGQD